jgi:hypothetical protein
MIEVTAVAHGLLGQCLTELRAIELGKGITADIIEIVLIAAECEDIDNDIDGESNAYGEHNCAEFDYFGLVE